MTACIVYRSEKKEETYLYLPVEKTLDDIPEELRDAFGEPSPVMKLDVEKETKLALADAVQVLTAFERQGYFLQLPPKVSIEELLDRRFG